jgi:hypothetical protein
MQRVFTIIFDLLTIIVVASAFILLSGCAKVGQESFYAPRPVPDTDTVEHIILNDMILNQGVNNE